MIEPATLEQIVDYITYDEQCIVLQGKQTECMFKKYELEGILSYLKETDVIGITTEENCLVIRLDDSYGDIDLLLEDPYGAE